MPRPGEFMSVYSGSPLRIYVSQNRKEDLGHRVYTSAMPSYSRRIFSANTALQQLEIQKVFLRCRALS